MAEQNISGMKRNFANYVPETSPQKAGPLPAKEIHHGENTSISRYVWLPIVREGERPLIRWKMEWSL